ncbi:hypothetical protein [Sphingobacterium detergens]|uniref:hypothetical protein n=1 Tax=Sphingobacterium detergens TaxID=1145106 RepID=UPI003AAEE2D2
MGEYKITHIDRRILEVLEEIKKNDTGEDIVPSVFANISVQTKRTITKRIADHTLAVSKNSFFPMFDRFRDHYYKLTPEGEKMLEDIKRLFKEAGENV